VAATARCFLELLRLDIVTPKLKLDRSAFNAFIQANPVTIPKFGISIQSNRQGTVAETKAVVNTVTEIQNSVFTHLHVHTQYSILDGAAVIKQLIAKAKNDKMNAVAITDHGNMFGAKEFLNEAKKQGKNTVAHAQRRNVT